NNQPRRKRYEKRIKIYGLWVVIYRNHTGANPLVGPAHFDPRHFPAGGRATTARSAYGRRKSPQSGRDMGSQGNGGSAGRGRGRTRRALSRERGDGGVCDPPC